MQTAVAPKCFACSSFPSIVSTARILGRAGDARALDRGDADAAAAEHDDRRARRDLCRVDRRPDAGRDAAADQGRDVEGHVVVDLHDAGLCR